MEKVLIFLKNFKFETKIYVKITLQTFQKKGVKMYKAFFRLALLGALTASLSLADDFLARATNGALSDNSVGVKKLTADEASKVVGGYGILENASGQQVFLLQSQNSGIASLTQIGIVIGFTDYEIKNSVSCGLGGDECKNNLRLTAPKSAYQQIASQANQKRGEYFALTTTKTATATRFGVQYKYNTAAAIVGVSAGKPYRIRSGTASGTIFNEVKRAYENQLNQILATQF